MTSSMEYPLVLAAEQGDSAAVQLHAKESPVHVRDLALEKAAQGGRIGCVRRLLDANVDPTTAAAKTALEQAVLAGHWGACTELLHYGGRLDKPPPLIQLPADIESRSTFEGAGVVMHACLFYEAVDAVTRGDIVALTKVLGDTPGLASSRVVGQPRTLLHYCTDWPGNHPSSSESIQCILDHKADVNATFENEWSLREGEGGHRESPLHWAASNDDVSAIDVLVVGGADMSQQGGCIGNGTALWDAAIFGQDKALKRLLELRADPMLECAVDGKKQNLIDFIGDDERIGSETRQVLQSHCN